MKTGTHEQRSQYRGSRKHVLDWTDRPTFASELLALLQPVTAAMTAESRWMPRGFQFPDEARLETFGPAAFADHAAWDELQRWWLVHSKGANTPNWDIALRCDIEGQPGLVLVEAKAHTAELKTDGKADPDKTPNSIANHERIGAAIGEARAGLQRFAPSVRISRDSHYQLANRLAFTWKLATLGIPTVLVYLGFVGDTGIDDVGRPVTNDADWQTVFWSHAAGVAPKALFERRLAIGPAPAWCLVRSRSILSPSSSPSDVLTGRRSR
jgi:hypothetical protein